MKQGVTAALIFTLMVLRGQGAEPTAAETNLMPFYICQNGTAKCRIVVANSSDQMEQDAQLKLGQELQTYIHKLSGTVLPVEGNLTRGTNDQVTGEMVLMALSSPVRQ